MKPLNGGQIVRLPVDQITVGPRLRRVSDAAVENLIQMAEVTGITAPIHVRSIKGTYELIDGAHRLEATKRMGLPDIAALLIDCGVGEARAMEATNNLGAARMTPLQTAIFAASWKKDYYERHPDRKRGVFKGNQYTGNVVSAEAALTNAICEAFAVQPRRAFRLLAVGERLTVAETGLLERAGRNLALDELEALSKIGEPEERLFVLHKLCADQKARVATARSAWKVEQGTVPAPKDPVEEAFKALKTAWLRAPKAARRRFLESEVEGVEDILADIREAGEE
jgi:ParB family chromosome partitioning protein